MINYFDISLFSSLPTPRTLPEHCIPGNVCCLFGSTASGKTQLLFQYAYNCALLGGKVTYICTSEQKLARSGVIKSLFQQKNGNISLVEQNALSRIELKYISNYIDLRRQLSEVHLHHQKTSDSVTTSSETKRTVNIIIVDDIDVYLVPNKVLNNEKSVENTTTPNKQHPGAVQGRALQLLAMLRDVANPSSVLLYSFCSHRATPSIADTLLNSSHIVARLNIHSQNTLNENVVRQQEQSKEELSQKKASRSLDIQTTPLNCSSHTFAQINII